MKGGFYWSVRRELWEHRAVFIAPLVVAGFVIAAVLLNIGKLQQQAGLLAGMPAAAQRTAVVMPFGLTASVILLISFVVGAFYCFDALNGERRDRSILFWKSLPVSDATTVLSKAFVPMAVQPAVGFVVALATQAVLLLLIAAILKGAGVDPGPLWEQLPVFPMTAAMLYGLVVHVLWYAPAFALFLLLSAWVRRPLLWAVVPILAVQAIEQIAFATSYSGVFLRWRVTGAMSEAFVPNAMREPITSLAQLDPIRFLTSPGLWGGLVLAAVFLYAAIHVRRHKEPL